MHTHSHTRSMPFFPPNQLSVAHRFAHCSQVPAGFTQTFARTPLRSLISMISASTQFNTCTAAIYGGSSTQWFFCNFLIYNSHPSHIFPFLNGCHFCNLLSFILSGGKKAKHAGRDGGTKRGERLRKKGRHCFDECSCLAKGRVGRHQ